MKPLILHGGEGMTDVVKSMHLVAHGKERQQERLTSSIRGHLTSAIADADWLSSEALMGQAEDDEIYLQDQAAKGHLYGPY